MRKKLIWEEYGMSLEEYAKAFNKALDKAFDRELEDKVYLFNFVCDRPRCSAIIKVQELLSRKTE